MMFGPGGRDHDSQKTKLFLSGETKILQPMRENYKILLESIILGKLKLSEIGHPEHLGKDGDQKAPKIRPIGS